MGQWLLFMGFRWDPLKSSFPGGDTALGGVTGAVGCLRPCLGFPKLVVQHRSRPPHLVLRLVLL